MGKNLSYALSEKVIWWLLTGYHCTFTTARGTNESSELSPFDLDIDSSQDLMSGPERVSEFDLVKFDFFYATGRSVLCVFRCFDDRWL
jgi:hypothetical protein